MIPFKIKNAFYINDDALSAHHTYRLDEESSRHLYKALRKKEGEEIVLLNGKGKIARSIVEHAHPKESVARILEVIDIPAPERRCVLGISLLKNAARWEWMVEKCVELGVNRIAPLLCERTEIKQKMKPQRSQSIIRSALIQSLRYWEPLLEKPMPFRAFVEEKGEGEEKYIAHCIEGNKTEISSIAIENKKQNMRILIGPEGDFTAEEVELAKRYGYTFLSLGVYRLRAETAAIYALSRLAPA